ncbi:MAG: hypothetical protein QNJ13_12675 [Paracoccaceae bacterium]|nr:hypothetical protein [Paracoccaceae bacterium]
MDTISTGTRPVETTGTVAIIGYEEGGPRADITLFSGRAIAVLDGPDVDGGHLIGFAGDREVAKDWCHSFFQGDASVDDRCVTYWVGAQWAYGFPNALSAHAYPLNDGRMLLVLSHPKCADLEGDPRKCFMVFKSHDDALDWAVDLHFALEPVEGPVQ